MLKDISEVFSLKEIALENIDLLPEYGEKVIYFVTAAQGESKNFLYIGFTINLRRKFKKHNRQAEFEFLNRIGYQVKILGLCCQREYVKKKGKQ